MAESNVPALLFGLGAATLLGTLMVNFLLEHPRAVDSLAAERDDLYRRTNQNPMAVQLSEFDSLAQRFEAAKRLQEAAEVQVVRQRVAARQGR